MEEERVVSQRGKRTMPADDEPAAAAAAPPVPPVGDAAFGDEPARFDDDDDDAILALPAPSHGSVLGGDDEDEDEDGGAYYYDYDMSGAYSSSSDDDDSDGEFEEHENRVRFWDSDAAGSETGLVAGPRPFLGRLTRFASFHGAAGFMRLAAAQACPCAAADDDDKRPDGAGGVIVVHYRLTRFSRARRTGAGGTHDDAVVEVSDFGTALHHVRYRVPFPVAAADAASSLRLAGASLAADAYPYRHYVQLQALWSGLVAAAPVRVPARAARLVVTVDVGVLRGEDDRSPERVERMRAALEALARENDAASPMRCGLEQRLPVPVPVPAVCCDDGDDESSSEGGGGGGAAPRPAKRMKRLAAAAGEVCAICHETLEQGLAAWPRCSHVFHGKCLEQLLVTVQHRCPMCRSTLSVT